MMGVRSWIMRQFADRLGWSNQGGVPGRVEPDQDRGGDVFRKAVTMRRTGTTLVEVLVAIFVMAIGLLTLLTLFPLGALSMSQAIKDNRTGQCAANAAACAAAFGLRNDDKVVNQFDAQSGPNPYKRDVFREALPHLANGTPDPRLPVLMDGNPSYPVLVDPQGVLLGATSYGDMGAASPGFPRRIPRFIWGPDANPFPRPTQFRYSWSWFANQDDMTFVDGIPPTALEREGRYTWMYLLKRKDVAKTTVVDLTVVVSSGRPFQVLGAGLAGETTFGSVIFDPATSLVKVPFTGTPPDFKKGQWVLDSSPPTPPVAGSTRLDTHGYFYRIVGVSGPITEAGQTKMVLELQNPPKEFAGNGKLTLFEHVVEVFEKGPGWLP